MAPADGAPGVALEVPCEATPEDDAAGDTEVAEVEADALGVAPVPEGAAGPTSAGGAGKPETATLGTGTLAATTALVPATEGASDAAAGAPDGARSAKNSAPAPRPATTAIAAAQTTGGTWEDGRGPRS